MSLIREVLDKSKGLIYVEQDVGNKAPEKRYLGLLPIPHGHPELQLPKFSTYLEANGLKLFQRPEWKQHEFLNVHTDVSILDQNGHGACEPYSWVSMLLTTRKRLGYAPLDLSSDFLYTLINGGRDRGSNAADAVAALKKYGVCTTQKVSGRPIRPPSGGWSKDVMEDAGRVKINDDDVFIATTIEEAVTAVIMRWDISIAVQAGDRYNTGGPNSDGTLAYCGRFLNHAQKIGEGLRVVGDKAQIPLRNSWTPAWGGGGGLPGGMGWAQESHLMASDVIYVLKGARPDPKDTTLPKPAKG